MKKFDELTGLCQNRCFNFSLTWQKMTDWSIEVYTGYSKNSYTRKFYTDGHSHQDEAIKKAIKYMKKLDKRGVSTSLGTPQY